VNNDMPTLGSSSRRGPARGLILGAAVVALVLIIWWWRHRSRPPTPPPPPAAAASNGAAGNASAATPSPTPSPAADARPSPSDDGLAGTGLKRLHAVVEGPLETSIVRQIGAEVGRPLTQVVVRALVWWVAVPNDLRKGDVIDALYAGDGDTLHLEALRFQSGKLSRTLTAWRFQPEGDRFARLYGGDARELELRLSDPPLDDYEQVTSLLRDGRGHQGVDFKTPLGSTVKAPFDGTIERVNWNWKMNGNSVELRESGGRHRVALFLHLSPLPKETHAGVHVSRGQAFAKSGNTGHSFAPHLHFQLMSSDGKLLDPFADPEATHRALGTDSRAAFDAAVKRFSELLDR
jgi:murein DD-endopeptidase MepM/ murein hydrolase activator NlpD